MHKDYGINKAFKRILSCIDRALTENGEKTTVQQKRTEADRMVR